MGQSSSEGMGVMSQMDTLEYSVERESSKVSLVCDTGSRVPWAFLGCSLVS